jgi:hypothetical protein
LRFYDSSAPSNIKIAYPNSAQVSIFEQGIPSTKDLASINSHFLGAINLELSANTRPNVGFDTSGNVLIPNRWAAHPSTLIDSASVDDDGWWKVVFPSLQTWVSLVGLPVVARYASNQQTLQRSPRFCYGCWALTDKVIGTGIISNKYIQPNCSSPVLETRSKYLGIAPYVNTVLNMTSVSVPTIQISQLYNNSNTIISLCTLIEMDVQAEILCLAAGCKATKIKATPQIPFSNTVLQNQTAANLFLGSLQLSMGLPSSNNSDDVALIDSFVQRRGSAFNPNPNFFSRWVVKDGKIAPDYQIFQTNDQKQFQTWLKDDLEGNLQKLLNTYLASSQQALQNTTSEHMIDVLRGATSDAGLSVANFKGAHYFPQYRLNYLWLVIDFIGCAVLLIAAAAAVWLRVYTLAPDILGAISSLTRDNPDLPGSSTLNGIDRARMLKDVKVRIADVGGQDGVGRVGLTVENGSSENVAKLQKGKPYL